MSDWTKVARMPWDIFANSVEFLYKASMPSGYEEKRHSDYAARGTHSEDELGGGDVKLVRSRLMFTKPGHEALLSTWEDVVDYNTNCESFAGLKLAKYLNSGGNTIADEDQRFLRVHIEVLDRFPKEDVDYETRRLDLLEQQVDILSSMRSNPVGHERRVA
jgi:hypothetical protein